MSNVSDAVSTDFSMNSIYVVAVRSDAIEEMAEFCRPSFPIIIFLLAVLLILRVPDSTPRSRVTD